MLLSHLKPSKNQPSRSMKFPLILEPRKPTEFEMQAELYILLKKRGFNVRGEVRAKSGITGHSQFDLVVFIGSYGACIIEVKDSPCTALIGGAKTRQYQKYAQYGLPIIYYTTIVPIENVVQSVESIIRGDSALS